MRIMRYSECCGARIHLTDICTACHEHCDEASETDESNWSDQHKVKSKCCNKPVRSFDIRICCACGANTEDRRDSNIQRAATHHYPDYDKIKKEYIKPRKRID